MTTPHAVGAYALILAGGEGTRLYPLSTPEKPKQFLDLYGGASLLQHTYRRLLGLFGGAERMLVATNARHVPLIRQQLPDLPDAHLIAEPQRKNTAPCIALAARLLAQRDPQAVMGVFPSDHYIGDEEAFRSVIRRAIHAARIRRELVTLGIAPTEPATTYGYIKRGAPLGTESEGGFSVERFTEKPDAETARGYLCSGGYFWNSGIFVWRVDVLLEQLAAHLPGVAVPLQRVHVDNGRIEADDLARFFAEVEGISIDYGLLERSRRVIVLEAAFDWSDLGSPDAVARLQPPPRT